MKLMFGFFLIMSSLSFQQANQNDVSASEMTSPAQSWNFIDSDVGPEENGSSSFDTDIGENFSGEIDNQENFRANILNDERHVTVNNGTSCDNRFENVEFETFENADSSYGDDMNRGDDFEHFDPRDYANIHINVDCTVKDAMLMIYAFFLRHKEDAQFQY